MEDLKQIQEFFSKPLEENVDKKYSDFLVALRDSGATNMFGAGPYLQAEFGLDKREAREILANWMRSFGESLNENVHVEAFKLGKALKGMGYDVKVKAVDDFGKNVFEIYFNNPADADDDSIFYDVKKLGYDNVRVFANPQESLEKDNKENAWKEFQKKHNVTDKTIKVARKDFEKKYKAVKEHETDPDMELKVGDYQTQHFHMCPGAKSLYQDIEDKVEDMGLAIRSAKLQDALFAMEESALENGANEADVFAAETIADQIMAMAAMMDLDKEHSYIQGHVDKIKGAVGKEQVDEGASSEEKRMAMQAIKRFAKYRGVSEKEAKADLIRAVKELGSIEEAINEIVETIQAGKVLEEKLCKKGKAYRKRRIAAGEKSSAYLSGRAVKVCKGQISGRKKRKKRKSKK